MRYTTPYKAAAGLGAARTGTLQHWSMTVTGAILAVLTPFFVYIVLTGLAGSDNQTEVIRHFGRPFPAIVTGLYLIIGLVHWMHGTRVLVDDYVRGAKRNWIMVGVQLIGWVLVAVLLWAMLRLTLGAFI